MKVIGLGAPDDLRVRFEACEIDVLVDALRGQRAIATRAAAETYCVAPGQTRMVDDSHDRLRAIEALLIQVEEQPQTPEGAILVGNTQLVGEVVHAGAREALRRLAATHERYQGHTGPQSGDALLDGQYSEGMGSDARRRRSRRARVGLISHRPASSPDGEPVMGVRQPPARKLPYLAAARAVRALEVLVFSPTGARGLAETMGLSQGIARYLLYTLEDEGDLQRGPGAGRPHYACSLTPRLLAGQLAARMPLISCGDQVVGHMHGQTTLDAYLGIPSYGDVLILASAGGTAPAPWSLLPATDSAGGLVLLAYRESWRDDQRPDNESPTRRDLDAPAVEVRQDGYALHNQGRTTSLAVPVPMIPTPLATLVLAGPTSALVDDDRQATLAVLRDGAARLGDSYHWRPRPPSTREPANPRPRCASPRRTETKGSSACPTAPSECFRPTEPTRPSAYVA
jgi:DNA-binding IclR family transcriptional regulator